MEPFNSLTTFERESIARKQVYYENKKDKQEKEKARQQIYNDNHKEERRQYYIDNKAKRCEMITCECGGKFQRRALNKHARTKMHSDYFNLRLRREAEETIMYVNLKRTPSEEDRRHLATGNRGYQGTRTKR